MEKLQIFTEDLSETWNDYNLRFLAVVQQQRCCSNPWSNAKLIQFYHQKKFVMLKLGCTLPNLAIFCPHKWTNKKIYPFCGEDEDFCEKTREVMTIGTSNVFTRKAVLDETFIRDSPNICKPVVGIDVSQLYPFSICQDMSTGLGGEKSSDSFLKAYKSSETKGFFPYEWFDIAHKLKNRKLPPYKAFSSKMRNNMLFIESSRIIRS